MSTVRVYDSFDGVPLDVAPEWEGDDRAPFERRVGVRGLFAAAAKLEAPDVYHVVVPYPGPIHEGMSGDPVYGIKRIVHRNARTLPVLQASPQGQRRRWGSTFTTKLRRAQRRVGVADTGVWDRATHNALAPWADAFAVSLLHAPPSQPTPQELQTNALMSFLMGFYNRRYNIGYDQARPTQLRPVAKITRADCSGSVAAGMWTAGVMPNVDWRWTNTDVQIMLGRPVTLGKVLLGDVAFYGHGVDPGHEACVVSTAADVRVFSFGSYPAKVLPIDYNRGSLGSRIDLRRLIT